ncbi:MAG TPA: histidine kinase [Casimicrobiaceae bacterium]|nr:histidine kinase [Casimicrobiaceae bacterium]
MPISATSSAPGPACPPGALSHPLEIIPVFRRWRRGWLRDFVYTLIWDSLIAVAFTIIATLFDARTPLWDLFRVNFLFAQTIGLSIHGLFVAGDWALPGMHQASLPKRVAYYSVVPVIGVFVGYWVGTEMLGAGDFRRWVFSLRGAMAVIALSLVITAILLSIFLQRERAARAEAAVAREQARVAAAERETTAARLKLLQAQVEPHFLYNTLANAISLIESDPASARRMLERLIELLRATASSPEGDGTVSEQLRWLRAYLDILALRMGTRLRWNIDVSDDVAAQRVPPMLLQPIVENAVKHGLEPKIEGGSVDIVGRREGERIRLMVRDTGLGFSATRSGSHTGLGIANLRARLAAWYGPSAQLLIEDNSPAGATVSLLLPATRP